jgi:hypothetical protein
MENLDNDIDIKFLDDHYNNNYNWNIISVSKDTFNSRIVFCGENKQNNNDCLYIKQFKLKFIDANNVISDISNVLKEA